MILFVILILLFCSLTAFFIMYPKEKRSILSKNYYKYCDKKVNSVTSSNKFKAIKVASWHEHAPNYLKFSCYAFSGLKLDKYDKVNLTEIEGHVAPSGNVFLYENGLWVMYEAVRVKDVQNILLSRLNELKYEMECINLNTNVISESTSYIG